MYRKSVKIALTLVYLVIIAGAVVRMTGSGMGCPDWPKCFGYYIPPSEISQLQFKPHHNYKSGQVIIRAESLQVAASNFTSAKNYNAVNWKAYTKHDYAIFNPTHTWVEYVNRLVGALAGLAVLFMAFLSFKKWKIKKRILILSWLCVFGMAFQAWLGATVVYSVLEPVKITLHMLMALIIVAVLLYILSLSSSKEKIHFKTKSFQNIAILAIVLSLIQISMGTQVRQFVDQQIKIIGIENQRLWLQNPALIFYIHRSFSILVLFTNAFLWWRNRKKGFGFKSTQLIVWLIISEIATGVAMYNFNFPFLSQAAHLVIASLLFGAQFYLLLECLKATKKTPPLA